MSLVAYGNSSASEDEDTDTEDEEMESGEQKDASAPRSIPFALPQPSLIPNDPIAEEDDEFLRKKAVPEEKPPPPPTVPKKKGPVKITIPSLSDFKDLDLEDEERPKKIVMAPSNKPSGLLNMLPKPKAEQLFQKAPETAPGMIPKTTTRSLVPHSVAKRTTAAGSKPTTATATTSKAAAALEKRKLLATTCESSDEDDEQGATSMDFFSLEDKDTLPTVSKNEINLMVAKKAAKIAESTAKFDRMVAREEEQRLEVETAAAEAAQQEWMAQQQSQNPSGIDQEALQSLIGGSRAKRARIDVDMIELSHEQIMPSRDEWLRTSVAGSTQAQVRGQLKDGPKGVAKKKHQITYLAHQAKSNEAELQAIWASNRTTQRQSQSKYGW